MSGQNCEALRDAAASTLATLDQGNADDCGVVLACTGCRVAWEPHPDDWATGNTGCPACGATTLISEIAQTRRGSS
jgi:hypothetical protein